MMTLRSEPCRGCGKPIAWALTAAGRWIPIDAAPESRGNLIIVDHVETKKGVAPRVNVTNDAPEVGGEPRYVAHFATCPKATMYRKMAKV
jgi:hypothetical protein